MPEETNVFKLFEIYLSREDVNIWVIIASGHI